LEAPRIRCSWVTQEDPSLLAEIDLALLWSTLVLLVIGSRGLRGREVHWHCGEYQHRHQHSRDERQTRNPFH